jgi:hypothetical protein
MTAGLLKYDYDALGRYSWLPPHLRPEEKWLGSETLSNMKIVSSC